MELSKNIRAFRKARSLTQEQLAEALGVTPGAVYKWEAGLSTPDIRLIMELADLFDTSVDVLLGYEVKNNKRAAALERLKDYAHRKDASGLAEAEKLLARYPNCFEIVHQSAVLYWQFGFMRRDKALLRRSVELMERAAPLLAQNRDLEISEASIWFDIAQAHFAMGEYEKAVEIFKQNNSRGGNNDFIGYILSAYCARADEAMPYLSKALLRCAASFHRVATGYFHAYFAQGDFRSATDILRVCLDFFHALEKPGQNSFLVKTSVELYACLAAAQLGMGELEEAKESLRTAKRLAEQFDAAPDYAGASVRFVSADKPMTAFDDMGDTAMSSIVNRVAAFQNETLEALWSGVRDEK